MRALGTVAKLAATLSIVATIALSAPALTRAATKTPPWADLNCSLFDGSAGLGAMDTTPACSYAQGQLTLAGYKAFANNGGPSAATVMGPDYAQSDAIWAIFGHANPGFITTYNSATGRTDLAAAPGISGNCAGNSACLSSYTSAQLHSIKLMIFAGCETALPGGGLGNNGILPRVAVFSKLVDAAVGWSGDITWPHMNRWTWAFFQYNGTFFNSATWAENQTYALYNDYGGSNNSVWYGNWNLSVRPAGYGS